MYNPPAFKVEDQPVLEAIMAAAPLATLVSNGPDGLAASHLPLLYLATDNLLIGHFSRANDHWRHLDGAEALAMFVGREGYVSPSWYASKAAHGKVVPTWNYEAVHASGRVDLLHDPEDLLALVSRLTDHHEALRAQPWAVTDAPARYLDGQLKGIVGLRMTVTKLEGKRKLSQNRPADDRAGVIAGLRQEADPQAEALAAAMSEQER
ncbi:MAG: FMN-binding negative transcriptional regulator [Pseudomonadota bacterium]